MRELEYREVNRRRECEPERNHREHVKPSWNHTAPFVTERSNRRTTVGDGCERVRCRRGSIGARQENARVSWRTRAISDRPHGCPKGLAWRPTNDPFDSSSRRSLGFVDSPGAETVPAVRRDWRS